MAYVLLIFLQYFCLVHAVPCLLTLHIKIMKNESPNIGHFFPLSVGVERHSMEGKS